METSDRFVLGHDGRVGNEPTGGAEAEAALARFDATAPRVFASLCRWLGGDRNLAASLLPQVYATPAEGGEQLAVAYRLAAATRVRGVRERALLDLAVAKGTSALVTGTIVGMRADDVSAAVQRAEAVLRTSDASGSIDDILRRSEHWFDDATRGRARASVAAMAGRDQTVRPPIKPWKVVAGVGVAAVVIAAVVALAGNDSSPRPETAASIVTSTTTTVVTRPQLPAERPGYVIDPLPPRLKATGASGQPLNGADTTTRGNSQAAWFDLWAEAGASRTSGRWVAVVSSQTGTYTEGVFEESARVTVNGATALLVTHPDGVLELRTSSILSRHGLDIVANGFSPEELQTMAASIGVTGPNDPTAGGAITEPTYGADFTNTAAGLSLLISRQTESLDFTTQLSVPGVSTSHYTDQVDLTSIDVIAAPAEASLDVIDRFLLSASNSAAAPTNADRTMQVGDRTVEVGALVQSGSRDVVTVLQWQQAEMTVVVSGTAPLDELLTVVPLVTAADADQWAELVALNGTYISLDGGPDSTAPGFGGRTYDLGQSTTANHETWRASLNVDAQSVAFELAQSNGISEGFELPIAIDDLSPVHTYNALDSSIVVFVARDAGGAKTMRLTIGDGDPVIVMLADLDSGVTAAMYAYSEIGPVTVDLLDVNGTVIRTVAA